MQRKEQTVAVAFNLDDTYNRVQFKLLMNLLMQYGISLTLTQWTAVVLLERTVAMQLGNWTSAPHQLTMGLPQGSLLLPVLFNVYTKGLADLNQNGPRKILTPVDNRLEYKTSKDSKPKQCNNNWIVYPSGVMTPDLSSIQTRHKHCGANRAAGKPMPAVTFDGAVVEQTSHLRYLGIQSDRMLTYRKHVETTALKCKKGLSVLKAMVAKGIEQCHLFLLYQSVVLLSLIHI